MMNNSSNGESRATIATLGAQVAGLDRDYQEIRRAVNALDNKFESSLSSMAARFDQSILTISNKLDIKSSTQWGPILTGVSIVITTLGLLGAMAYYPLQRDNTRLDAIVNTIVDKSVFQRQYDADETRTNGELKQLKEAYGSTILARRYETDQARLIASLEAIHGDLEKLRVRSYDANGKIVGAETRVGDIDKRLDAISKRLADYISQGQNNKL